MVLLERSGTLLCVVPLFAGTVVTPVPKSETLGGCEPLVTSATAVAAPPSRTTNPRIAKMNRARGSNFMASSKSRS
jgi:hypothetical protein